MKINHLQKMPQINYMNADSTFNQGTKIIERNIRTFAANY